MKPFEEVFFMSPSDHSTEPVFTYNISVAPESQIIEVTAIGNSSPNDIISMYREIGLFIRLHKKKLLLLDVVNLKLNYSGDKVVRVLEAIKNDLRSIRVARIVSPADFKSDLIDLFAKSNQLNIKSFYLKEEAIAWLNAN